MLDYAVLWSWAEFAVRWLHVITAMAWIGSSFYFIALDLGLHRDRNLASGADGEEWQVHGGGFYHIQKYLVAPARLPKDLVWFKWESYATWLSGFALLVLVYWLGQSWVLIDPAVADLTRMQAIGLSGASLAFGWIAYDLMCRSRFGDEPFRLMLGLFALIVVMSVVYTSVFTGRAALLHLGAFTASIMTGNVFFVIMPNQRVVVADLKAGRTPAAKYGKIAKQRSTHNNYLTLPVVFLMLSNHYPLAFGGPNAWAIACLVFLMGVTIRHWFNTTHARAGTPHWTWAVTALLFLLIAWLSVPSAPALGRSAMAPDAVPFAEGPGFREVANIVQGRCSMCHAAEPFQEGVLWAPRGVHLETDADIAGHARAIYLNAGVTHAMPPANVSGITPPEREAIRAWYRGVAG